MTAPSNANTSGLDVVAWRMRQLHHEIDGPITGWMYCPPSQHPSGNARWEIEPLVTAASAQAAIDAVHACAQEEADRLASKATDAEIVAASWKDRATAAEARADRLAKALEEIKAGVVLVVDEELQCVVESSMDGEEASEKAAQALKSDGGK